jgi:opacity protein-like surface antigen
MHPKLSCVLILAMAFSSLAPAQTTGTNQAANASADQSGKEIGGYEVQQSIELGYRFSDVVGSTEVYNTFINQHQGPRLFEQTLNMRAMSHAGAIFDRLSASSFGWGGDPENAARLSVSKDLWYDFNLSFRRDKNFFDYNLLANPLNPPTSNPNVPVPFSPHATFVTRRMYDANLTILPQSKVSVRLGFSRNRSEGPSFSSFHEGTDPLLNQAWNVTSNDYFVGFDVKVLPQTTISYDQAVSFDKNDTDYTLAPFAQFLLPDGTPVSLGLPFNTTAGQPCKAPLIGGFVNPTCNLYIQYLRNQRVRTTTPTERLSLRSNYFRRVNVVAEASYSSASLDSPYFEFFNGLVSRTGDRQFSFSGPASNRRVAFDSYAGVTVALTKKLNLEDNFRYDNFRIPGQWNSTESHTAGIPVGTPPAPNVLLSPLAPAAVTTALIANFLGQKSFYNEIGLDYSPSKRAGVRVGYRFRHRRVFKAEPEILPDPESGLGEFEGDTIEVNEHTPFIGVWVRPIDSLRISGEVEETAADNFITRISPRHRQHYRARINYRPKRWATVGGSADINESSNGQIDTQFDQHYRNAGFLASLFPNTRIGVDLAYNYTDSGQSSLICFAGTFTPAGTLVNGCPTFDSSDNPNANQTRFHYINHVHYVSGNLRFQPVKRVTLLAGYGLTRSDGDETILNPLQPLGPLQFTFHRPQAGVKIEFVPNVSVNANWNYDQYGEDSFIGPTNARNFHDNRAALSLRYEF